MKQRTKKSQGFTMVEVVVAAVIFALTAAGFYATIAALTSPAESASKRVTAAFLAKQKLEELRTAVNADDWEKTHDVGYLLEENYPYSEDVVVDHVTYHIDYTLTPDGNTDGREIDLQVTW